VRNMSFTLTTRQVRAGTKTVTRRLGWVNLKPGDVLMACEKCQGIPKGEKVVKIRAIRVVSVYPEPLHRISYGWDEGETAREGFPDLGNAEFIAMFMKAMKCGLDAWVNRIEFEYVEKGVTL
jgi:hypothetical protein